METADIYIAISRKCPRAGSGRYIAILEATTERGKTGTLTLKKSLDDVTPHQLELIAVRDALRRFTRSVTVNIHSGHGWFKTITERGWLGKWQQADFKKDGNDIPMSDLYREIMITYRSITVGTTDKDLGTYKTWLENEIKKPVSKRKKAASGDFED